MSRRRRRRKSDVKNQAAVVHHGPYRVDDERFTGQIVNPPPNKYPVTRENALGHSGVWRAVNFICDKVAATPLYVRRRSVDGGSEIDRAHPSHRLVRRKASNIMLALEWKRAAMFHTIYTAGNSFSYIKPGPARRFNELILLDPLHMIMFILFDSVETQAGILQSGTVVYEYNQQGKKFILSQDEVFHVRGLSYNGIFGLPIFEYVKHAAGAGNVARDFAFKFFERGANPAFAVFYPRALSPEREDAWLKTMKDAVEGIGHAHQMFPMYNDAKIQELTRDPDKTQGLEGRQFSLRESANFYGVPASTVNVEDAQSYNSLEMASLAELDAVDPWFVRMEEEANDKLLTTQQKESESHFFEFAREEVKRLDHETRVTTAVTELNNGGLNQDEYRNIMKRPAGQNENSDRFRMPANMVYMDGEPVSNLPVTNVKDAVFDSTRRGFERIASKLVRLCSDQEKLDEFVQNGQAWHDIRPKIEAALNLVPDGDEAVIEDWLAALLDDVKALDDRSPSSIRAINEQHLRYLEARVCQFVLSTGA